MATQRGLHSRADTTKRVDFNLDLISSGASIVVTFPNISGTLFDAASTKLSGSIPNVDATDVHAAIVELQESIDALNTASISDYIAGNGPPDSGDGSDGNYYLDVVAGDIYGPKAAGAWPMTPIGNIYSFTTIMTGATSVMDGQVGLVPQPLAGDEAKVLRGSGLWEDQYDSVTPSWTVSTFTSSRTITGGDTTLQELSHKFATLVADLQARGVIP
jgi:hypothetical protein